MSDDWTHEETDDPLHADQRNFYKVEKWSGDGQRVVEMLFAGSSLAKAQRIFERFIRRRPRSRLTIGQRSRVLQEWPPGIRWAADGRRCATAMNGWRWIGIIGSVVWFFGFGVLFWNQYVEDAVAPYAQDLKICSAIEEYSDHFWHENARDTEELSEKLQANQDEYEKCASKAKLRWESERPSDSMAIAAVLVIDLVTIALGWLVVWGCVALGRWVHRRFAVN